MSDSLWYFRILSDQVNKLNINVYNLDTVFLNCDSLQKRLAPLISMKTYMKYQNLTLINLEKLKYFPHCWSNESFKGTVRNGTLPSLHGGSLKIMLSVP